MNNATPPSILVIEDNTTTARSICLFLADAGFEPSVADCGSKGLSQLDDGNFELVLLDLNLPDIDGLDVCKQIREAHDVPIVMLTARSSEEDIVRGLECGAQDYVSKPFGSRELIARVRRAIRDSKFETGRQVLQHAGLELDLTRRSAAKDDQRLSFTKSEFDLLAVLMARPGRVFTRAQLIDLALGADFDGFDRTIDTHIWSIRKKLGDNRSAPKFIHSELGVGYRFADAV